MKKQLLMIAIIGALLSTAVFSGCVQQSGTGQLVMKITDDPDLNITKANVTFTEVRVHLGLFGNQSENETNGTAGWYTVVNETQTFDLIALENVTAIFGSANLSAGWYTQIRLIVQSAVITIDGVEHNCTIPSHELKLIRPFRISENETTTLILDFDVEKSIHETGSGKYMFKPTIQITQE